MNLTCKLVKKVNKSGVVYECLEIYLTDSYKKFVFLTSAEKEILDLCMTDSQKLALDNSLNQDSNFDNLD